jgi:leukotriene A-4 hydrolase/aminopeptidase
MKKAIVLIMVAAACSQPPAEPTSSRPTTLPKDSVPKDSVAKDASTYANLDAFVARHLVLDLTADFKAKTLSGTAELRFDRRDPNPSEVVLDTRDLTIEKAEAASGSGAWMATTHRLDAATPAFGSALRIAMPAGADRVRVTYSTSPSARGLQWLAPSQTAGKKRPFLFSQAQAIQARSFIPLQDTPGVRMTYDATIRTPKDLVAVMAAETEPSNDKGIYRFRMPQAIPSYLIAIAIGDLAFKPMSDRTGVWAEPSVVDAAAREFDDTEKMIVTTEKLYGPYRWGRYDILVLPPSFPFGGMENPRLTFATPTVIAGDKSLVALVAHELAHSWSGNLVTSATWRDFWLNEGFTTYLERRIVEALYGKHVADMQAAIGVSDLAESRKTLEVPGDRTLLPDLAGRDPDDAFSNVPYEQGRLFLVFLESKFGRDAFDRFLRKWFDEHAFESATTEEFLAFLKTNLLDTKPGAVTDAQIQEWLHSDSIPSFAVLPVSDAFAKVEQARDEWLKGGSMDGLAKTASAWSTQEWIHFVDSMPRKMEPGQLMALDRRFTLTESRNSEVAHVWYRLAIANRYTAAYPAMERYMIRIGRRKLIVPLYRDLAAYPEGLALANRIFAKARDGYHPLAQTAVADILTTKT